MLGYYKLKCSSVNTMCSWADETAPWSPTELNNFATPGWTAAFCFIPHCTNSEDLGFFCWSGVQYKFCRNASPKGFSCVRNLSLSVSAVFGPEPFGGVVPWTDDTREFSHVSAWNKKSGWGRSFVARMDRMCLPLTVEVVFLSGCPCLVVSERGLDVVWLAFFQQFHRTLSVLSDNRCKQKIVTLKNLEWEIPINPRKPPDPNVPLHILDPKTSSVWFERTKDNGKFLDLHRTQWNRSQKWTPEQLGLKWHFIAEWKFKKKVLSQTRQQKNSWPTIYIPTARGISRTGSRQKLSSACRF